ncbi:DeoR C terminal sensor domain-containing protein [Kosakonia sp. AG348]|nr:DeoR C terminal sensor domain-containing protein [Kosakonia sp. AG348]
MTIIGGRSQSCIGEHRRKLPQNIWPDLALFSRNGWDLPRGISAQTEEKAALKHDLIVNAKRRGALADSSKDGAWSLFNVANPDSLTDIITDTQRSPRIRQQLTTLPGRLTAPVRASGQYSL